jgi:hypothetical protein
LGPGCREFESRHSDQNRQFSLRKLAVLTSLLLPRIYEQVTGEKFIPTEMTGQTSFGSAEWDMLSSVCKDLFPEEELLFETVARIVDIESQATEQKTRHGVVKSVESQLKKGFYKNEQDAQKYAMRCLLSVRCSRILGGSELSVYVNNDDTSFNGHIMQ